MPRPRFSADGCSARLNRVPSETRLPFRWTVNTYQGCSHSCRYYFAHAYHEYLGVGDAFAGADARSVSGIVLQVRPGIRE